MYYVNALKKLQEMYGEKTYAKVYRYGRHGQRRLDVETYCELQLMIDLLNKFDKKTLAKKLGVNFKLSEPLPDSTFQYKHHYIYRSEVDGDGSEWNKKEAEVWVLPRYEYEDYEWMQHKESLGLDTHSYPWWLWKG